MAEKGGLATAKSKVLRLSLGFLKYGAASVLPRHNSAVWVAVQDHVHPRQRPGRVVHLLAVDRDVVCLVGGLEQQRAGTAGGVVDGLVRARAGADADHLCHDARDFGRRVELPLALARLGGEMPHQVLVGVAQQVVASGAVGAEVETVEYGNQLRKPILHFLARTELALVVEIGLIDDALEIVGIGKFADDLVDPVTDLLVALQGPPCRRSRPRRALR